jgi:hypothetical protein
MYVNDSKKLTIALNFLNDEWDQVTSVLEDDDLFFLQEKLQGLETKLSVAVSENENNTIAKDFLQVFSKISALNFLATMDATQMRSVSLLEDDQEAIKTKLLDCTKIICEKIDVRVKGAKTSHTSRMTFD